MQCNTERYDVTGVYDNSTIIDLLQVGGNYFIYGGVLLLLMQTQTWLRQKFIFTKMDQVLEKHLLTTLQIIHN